MGGVVGGCTGPGTAIALHVLNSIVVRDAHSRRTTPGLVSDLRSPVSFVALLVNASGGSEEPLFRGATRIGTGAWY